MKEALVEAERAYAMGEVPVGAVVVKDGDIITVNADEGYVEIAD